MAAMPKIVSGGEKVVFVTVYVERQRTAKRRRILSSQDNNHNQPYHPITLTPVDGRQDSGDSSRGYNRRAELLRYSQRLRESAQSSKSTPHYHKQEPSAKAVEVQRKHRKSRVLGFMCNWKVSIPSFPRSFGGLLSQGKKKRNKKNKQKNGTVSETTNLAVIKRSIQAKVQKNWGFISKLMYGAQKQR
ncbi:hypothetical protein Syun_018661 [Stephania yunnanensis]|uniref:Uncharacterized protein n=1 Tax=Stephania yunnanensis TaxID=152371 RepID=A0AAP0NWK6_9MAGN